MVYYFMPNFTCFWIDKKANVKWSLNLVINKTTYRLAGMIYYNDFHFTSRVISATGDIWFHNDMQKEKNCQFEGNLDKMSMEMLNTDPDGRFISIVIYVLS